MVLMFTDVGVDSDQYINQHTIIHHLSFLYVTFRHSFMLNEQFRLKSKSLNNHGDSDATGEATPTRSTEMTSDTYTK